MIGASLPRLQAGQRAFVAGPTGSGKTVVMREQLLKPLPQRIIVISPKCDFEWKCDDPRFSRPPARSVLELGQMIEEDSNAGFTMRGYRLFAPIDDYAPKKVAKIDLVFDWAMKLGDTCVAVDDVYSFTGGNSSHQYAQERLPHCVRAVTQGRAFKVSVVIGAQRAFNSPLIFLTEANLRITFYMRDGSDQKRMEEYCGNVPWDVLKENDFSFVWATDREQSDVIRLDPKSLAA